MAMAATINGQRYALRLGLDPRTPEQKEQEDLAFRRFLSTLIDIAERDHPETDFTDLRETIWPAMRETRIARRHEELARLRKRQSDRLLAAVEALGPHAENVRVDDGLTVLYRIEGKYHAVLRKGLGERVMTRSAIMDYASREPAELEEAERQAEEYAREACAIARRLESRPPSGTGRKAPAAPEEKTPAAPHG